MVTVYAGDMTKWKKLANSIHLLAVLRLSEVNATKAASEFNGDNYKEAEKPQFSGNDTQYGKVWRGKP